MAYLLQTLLAKTPIYFKKDNCTYPLILQLENNRTLWTQTIDNRYVRLELESGDMWRIDLMLRDKVTGRKEEDSFKTVYKSHTEFIESNIFPAMVRYMESGDISL